MVWAAVYCRVSTTDQREEGTSLYTQRDHALLKASELEWNVPPEYIIQEDWTGQDLQRLGLLRLLELGRSGKIGGVIIYTLDRLYCPENDGDEWRVFEVLQQFQDAGVEMVWVDPSIPTSGPLSAVFTFLDAWRAGRERRAILERTTLGRLQKARRGMVISRAAASFCYLYNPETSTLVVQEEAKTVRLIFHLYTRESLSLVQLADWLNRLGVARHRGGQRWYTSHLGRMMRNEAYAGTLWQNRWQGQKVLRKTGQKPKAELRERPKSEQIPVTVPAIIPKELFDVVQNRLEDNLRLARRNAKREYLLSGLVKHACGSVMGGPC